MNRHNPTEKTKKKKRLLLITAIAVALIAVAFLLLRGCGCDGLTSAEPEAIPIYLEEEGNAMEGAAQTEDPEDIVDELEKQQLVVTDKLNSNIKFPSGEAGTIGEWVVENPEGNTVIQQAEVYLGDVLIAKSPAIYPNQHITGVELREEVESGEYEVIAYLNYYDIDTKEFISKAGYKVHLTVG